MAHGLPGSSGAGLDGVVAALAVRPADRVHRRQVEHVDAEVGQLVEVVADVGQGADRAGEQLVPGGEQRPLGLDVDLDHGRGGGLAGSEGGPRRLPRAPAPLLVGDDRAVPAAQSVGRRRQGGGRCAAGARRPAASSSAAPARSSEVRSSPASSLRRVPSRQVATSSIQARTRNRWVPTASGTKRPSQRSSPGLTDSIGTSVQPLAPGRAVGDGHRQVIVAVGEDGGGDIDGLTDHPLDGEAAPRHLRREVLDHDPARGRRQPGHPLFLLARPGRPRRCEPPNSRINRRINWPISWRWWPARSSGSR